ncbi:sigma-54 dependent transcriptional regulator [Motilimonas sp. 1_MG-2023]|uniref:sigma-54-dependent transcriptional regulator n=1 Tax=unclassified Motilimonas TaxID=2643697 RepID=UPI001E5CB990|nr:sigma-54 dependent transcriptional regulator [Motilimonas sp. 1_MG-2023]MCE0558023.1 sigma-54 dependent transcriptional regulator [Motilimonas sp. E26]MDO6526028.1 sigma-54 dependent transcriptional regulator [Motilimonas sp. 1_MG-2023]
MKTVLLVDDDLEFTELACRIIEYLDCDVYSAATLAEAKQWLNSQLFDHILLDFMLPDGSGLHLIDFVKANKIKSTITMITGHPAVKTAISAMCHDDIGHLTKPIEAEDLKAIFYPRSARAKANKEQPDAVLYFDCLLGESAPMKEMYTMIERVAKTNANVMLLGESGVGKEMVAQAIHNASEYTGERVSVNCGAIPKDLIGSELFGHEKGAFTGASGQKQGVFELAQGGTLFLDELTEMPIDMQPNLLRVLETQTVTRVGGNKSIPINCRVVSATNRTVEDIAMNNVLREDVYFRLAVFPITIPPLRARKEDIPLLAHYFLGLLNKEHSSQLRLRDEDMAKLLEHHWPGNIRELKHTIHRAFIMADMQAGNLVFPTTFESPFSLARDSLTGKGGANAVNVSADSEPANLQYVAPSAPITAVETSITVGQTIDELEKELIYKTLASVEGNKTNAAKMLGISTKTLYNRLNAYEESSAP